MIFEWGSRDLALVLMWAFVVACLVYLTYMAVQASSEDRTEERRREVKREIERKN